MDSRLEQFLGSRDRLFVRQEKEWVEIAVDWETANRYTVLDTSRQAVGYVAERGGGLGTQLKRWFLRSHRPFEIQVLDPTGQSLMRLSRSFFWLFSHLSVNEPDGKPLGIVQRRFGILYKRYDLRDETGQVFAQIAGPRWRLWTFPVTDASAGRTAVIAKRWGGALREVFTDADTFLVDFAPNRSAVWTPGQRAVIFAAAISIDFDFFENNQGRGGITGLFRG